MIVVKNKSGKILGEEKSFQKVIDNSTDNWSAADLSNISLSVLDFKDKQMSASKFTGSRILRCTFRDQSMSFSYFSRTTIRETTFDRVDLTYTDFTHAHLETVTFTNCDFRGAIFNYTSFINVSFVDCFLPYYSYDLMSYLLRKDGELTLDQLKIAGFVNVAHDHCWDDMLKLDDPLTDWALDTITAYVRKDDPRHIARMLLERKPA